MTNFKPIEFDLIRIEYLGIWERIYNPNFNYGEFAIIKSQVGLNSYKTSVKEWVKKTNAIGLVAKDGCYGGTYAHKNIAFEFAAWVSVEFKLYLIKEFQISYIYASEADIKCSIIWTNSKTIKERLND